MKPMIHVKVRLKELEKTQKWLAGELGVEAMKLYAWTGGFSPMPSDMREKMDNILNCPQKSLKERYETAEKFITKIASLVMEEDGKPLEAPTDYWLFIDRLRDQARALLHTALNPDIGG